MLIKQTKNFLFVNIKNGFTYLHLAVYLQNPQLVRIIGKKNEKSLKIKNSKNQLPIDMANDEIKIIILAIEEQNLTKNLSF